MLKLAPVKPRTVRRAGTLAGVAAAASLGVLLVIPQGGVVAQQRTEVQTPFGRAPLTFADIVEKVKPAVVSIHASNGAGRSAKRGPRPGTPDSPASARRPRRRARPSRRPSAQ